MLERMAVSRPRCLSCELPGEHGGVLHGPQARVPAIQLLNHRLIRRQAGRAQKLLPEGEAGQLAFVVGVPVGPVEGSKRLKGRPVMRSRAAQDPVRRPVSTIP
jgi:hypothetical protein